MAERDALLSQLLNIHDLYTIEIEYDGKNNPIYVGEAVPGSDTKTSSKIWRIMKITYDVNNNATAIKWANGSRAFQFAWDSRATYTFS